MKRLVTIVIACFLAVGCSRRPEDVPNDVGQESNLELVFVANEGVYAVSKSETV